MIVISFPQYFWWHLEAFEDGDNPVTRLLRPCRAMLAGRVPFRVVLRPILVDHVYLEHTSSGIRVETGGFSFLVLLCLISQPALRNHLPAPPVDKSGFVLPDFRQLNQLLVEILQNQAGEAGAVGFKFRGRYRCVESRGDPEFCSSGLT